MKKLLFLLALFSVSPVLAQNATSFCSKAETRVFLRTNLGNPKYISQYSKKDFLKKAGAAFSPYTLGLTVYQLDIDLTAKPSIAQNQGVFCVYLKELDVNVSYPDLTVYIDKKYPANSCEYKTIKEHEDYHVMVAQQALSFFKQDIEKEVRKALQNIAPQITHSQEGATKAAHAMVHTLQQKLNPIIQHINKKLEEKNAAIDTKEMYRATTKVCKNW